VSAGQAGAFLKCYEMLNPWSLHVRRTIIAGIWAAFFSRYVIIIIILAGIWVAFFQECQQSSRGQVQESFDYILCSDDDIYPCDTADRLPIFSDYHASTPRPLVFTQCCLLLC